MSALMKPSFQAGSHLTGSEVAAAGLNTRWYAELKSRGLAELHFRGGFRGLLNNNIGNDVIETPPDGKIQFLFCDFDSFKLVEMPAFPSREFLDAFALQCAVEVVKGSLPILDFVRVSDGSAIQEVISCVGSIYRQKSSLWNSYLNHAHRKAHELSWDWSALETAFDRAFETTAFLDASCSVILSEYAVQRYRRSEKWNYVPHEAE